MGTVTLAIQWSYCVVPTMLHTTGRNEIVFLLSFLRELDLKYNMIVQTFFRSVRLIDVVIFPDHFIFFNCLALSHSARSGQNFLMISNKKIALTLPFADINLMKEHPFGFMNFEKISIHQECMFIAGVACIRFWQCLSITSTNKSKFQKLHNSCITVLGWSWSLVHSSRFKMFIAISNSGVLMSSLYVMMLRLR